MITRFASAALVASLAAVAIPGTAQAGWQLWPSPVPPGGQFEVPPGDVGDLSFWAPNRGLMTVGGTNGVPEGIYSWDGDGWHQLATVCGAGMNARIAWAGPDEFWTLARPSLPRTGPAASALCHFKGGEVVGSYSTPVDADDPYHPMQAASCNGPSDCWFGGIAGRDGLGQRSGAFHLHWDGTTLTTVYGRQGRAVSDTLFAAGTWWESTYLGPSITEPRGAVELAEAEPEPRLLHRIAGATFANDPFVAAQPADSELRALDADGQTVWAAGGGVDSPTVARVPLVARLQDGAWDEVELSGDGIPTDLTVVDIAAVPGTGTAWAALDDTYQFSAEQRQPKLAFIAADGTVTMTSLTSEGEAPRGAMRRLDCPTATDCWAATARGYTYRWTPSGIPDYPADSDPAFQGTITSRPNEAAEQSIPDEPPQDDSALAAPPVELPVEPAAADTAPGACRAPQLITGQKANVRGRRRLRLVVSFRLTRNASVGVTASRRGKVVARARPKPMRRGRRSIALRVTRKRWPTKLRFVIRNAAGTSRCVQAPAGDQDTVST